MELLGFTPCKVDPDLWMRMVKRPNDLNYQEYVGLYVVDCLAISMDHKSIIVNEIGKYFQIKEALVEETDIFLGGKVRKMKDDLGVEFWTFSLLQILQGK